MNNRVGIWLLLLATLGMISCNMSTPISPGELSDVHKQLEGTTNCTQCHTLGKRISNKKCLACHEKIKNRVKDKKGFHASKEVKKEKCIKCHSDHHGRKFEIIHFDTLDFNHELTGYKLDGKHAESYCHACHKAENIRDKKFQKRHNTFMGLQSDCFNCHKDYHQNSLPRDCKSCHDFKGFSPAAKFKHEQADFALSGKHKDVKCEKCHPKSKKNNKDFQQFAGIQFDRCTRCHEDKHDDRFGQDCEKCHSVASFQEIKNMSDFDHRLTGFLLVGKHKNVGCKKCHPGKFTTPVAHAKCSDCHEDYHKDQLKKNGKSPDCQECHTVNTFTITSYQVEQHNKGSFPLVGAHEATPCIDCHKKTQHWSFRNIGLKCAECHKNIHKNIISVKYFPAGNCTKCHNPDKWSKIIFDHSVTRFALLGKHEKQTCRKCHFKDENGKTIQHFSGLGSSCTTCHDDKHNHQFDENGATDCILCHAFDNWKAVSFDHSDTHFKLDGSHKNVACNKCHKQVVENNITFVQYKLKDYRCEACH